MRRGFASRVSILVLLLTLAVVAYLETRRQERLPADWANGHPVLVCPLVDRNVDLARLQPLLDESAARLTAWLAAQHARVSGGAGTPARFDVAPAVVLDDVPPVEPQATDPFLTRWLATRRFLRFFTSRERLFPDPRLDASRIFLCVAPHASTSTDDDVSVGTRRQRLGVVFASDDPDEWGNALAVVMHETLHTVGALDHRNVDGTIRLPDGYADPTRSPLYPQDHAEIMALGIPTSATDELRVSSLDEVLLGPATAREIGWTGR